MPYALCPMPYALCPMPYAYEHLMLLIKAIHFLDSIEHQVNLGYRLCGGGFTTLFAVLKYCW